MFRSSLLLLASVFFIKSYSQTFESVKAQYPDDNGVILDNSEHVTLSFDKSGNLTATSKSIRESMVLKDNAINLFNTASVDHSFFNQLVSLQAETLVPDKKGYKAIKTNIQKTTGSASESIFYDDAEETTVTFTNLLPGAKTHIEYGTLYSDIHLLPRFYFKSYLPELRTSFSVTYPKGVNLGHAYLGSTDTSFAKMTTVEDDGMITTTWEATDVTRGKLYDNAPTPSYYLPHIAIYVKSYTNPVTNKEEVVLRDVDALYNYVYGLVKNNINEESSAVKSLAEQLTANMSQPKDKAKAIYKWVQHNVKYVAYEDSLGGFVPRKASVVCQRKFGDCKDMATLLRNLCRAVGLDAHVVWIGTRHIPYTFEQLPAPSVFNHMIAVVKLDGKWVFMDGTDATANFGVPPYAISGKEALIELGDGKYEIAHIPVTPVSENLMIDSSYIKINDRAINGSASIEYTGYPAGDLIGLMMYKNERDQKDAMNSLASRGSNKYMQDTYDYQIVDSDSKKVLIHTKFSVGDYVSKVGDEYYINMNLNRNYSGSKIDAKDRNVPVEIDYPVTLQNIVELTIPDGYKVTYIPQDISYQKEGLASCSFNYKSENNKVILSRSIIINAIYVNPLQFDDFNKFVNTLQNNYRESIVLSPM